MFLGRADGENFSLSLPRSAVAIRGALLTVLFVESNVCSFLSCLAYLWRLSAVPNGKIVER
jgi:hypothetical protein